MKHFYTLIFVIVCLSYQAQLISKKVIQGTNTTFHASFGLATKNNQFLSIGQNSYSFPFIAKLDSIGTVKWVRTYQPNPSLFTVAQLIDAVNSHDSAFAVIGMIDLQNNSQSQQAICMKLKANGDTLWCRFIHGASNSNCIPYSIDATLDSGFVVSGKTGSSAFVAKITKNGSLNWMKLLNYSAYNMMANTGRQTPDSGYVITGKIYGGDSYTYLAKLDKSGNLVWCKKYVENLNTSSSEGYDVLVESTGYLLLAQDDQAFHSLIRTNLSGNILWSKKYSSGVLSAYLPERTTTIKRISAHRSMILEKGTDYGNGTVTLVDSLGVPQWASSSMYTGIDMTQLKNNWFVLTENATPFIVKTSSPSSLTGQIGLVITDTLDQNSYECSFQMTNTSTTLALITSTASLNLMSSGLLSPFHPTLGIEPVTQINGCIEIISGLQNQSAEQGIALFPNPTSGKISISSSLLSNGSVLEIMDVSGRCMRKEILDPVSGVAEADLGSLNAGVYFYSLYSGSVPMAQGKILLSK